jgi:hypothetical protein
MPVGAHWLLRARCYGGHPRQGLAVACDCGASPGKGPPRELLRLHPETCTSRPCAASAAGACAPPITAVRNGLPPALATAHTPS